MSTFRALPPKMALAFVERGGVENAARLILDFIAAGVVQTRALVTDIIHADGERTQEWRASISQEVWKRIIQDGADEAMWQGEAIRLKSAGFIDGHREIVLTGIQLDAWGLLRVVRFHNPSFFKGRLPKASEPTSPIAAEAAPAPLGRTERKSRIPPASAVSLDGEQLTITETKTVLRCGQTKVYSLINAKKLEKRDTEAGPRVTTKSIKDVLGIAD